MANGEMGGWGGRGGGGGGGGGGGVSSGGSRISSWRRRKLRGSSRGAAPPGRWSCPPTPWSQPPCCPGVSCLSREGGRGHKCWWVGGGWCGGVCGGVVVVGGGGVGWGWGWGWGGGAGGGAAREGRVRISSVAGALAQPSLRSIALHALQLGRTLQAARCARSLLHACLPACLHLSLLPFPLPSPPWPAAPLTGHRCPLRFHSEKKHRRPPAQGKRPAARWAA